MIPQLVLLTILKKYELIGTQSDLGSASLSRERPDETKSSPESDRRRSIMARLNTVQPEAATGNLKRLFDGVQHKLGMVPNMIRAMANSPAIAEGYVQLSGALSHGRLSGKVREQLALAISEANGCDYCLAAHTAIGKMFGLTENQIRDARHGESVDAKTDVLLRFARKVNETHGKVSDDDLAEVRAAGFDDGAIAEVVGEVALNVLTNYFNNVAETTVDFPAVAPLEPATV
jgi:uncharacterized peroxidase-related enzyme